jgi:hypothetical protein
VRKIQFKVEKCAFSGSWAKVILLTTRYGKSMGALHDGN